MLIIIIIYIFILGLILCYDVEVKLIQ